MEKKCLNAINLWIDEAMFGSPKLTLCCVSQPRFHPRVIQRISGISGGTRPGSQREAGTRAFNERNYL